MQFELIRYIIVEKLEKELAPHLTYHDAQHTIHIIEHANELALHEGIAGDDLQLLLTAALFHDTGYIKTQSGHELISCDYAREYLPDYGYTPEEITQVCNIIMATQLPQTPGDKLAEILCDADLYYLGTDSYLETAEKLFTEIKSSNPGFNKEQWIQQQASFIEAHHYFTKTAQAKLSHKKHQNLAVLKTSMSHVSHDTHSDFQLSDLVLILAGVVIAGFALRGFLIPNNFFDGGVTGISLLIHEIYHFKIAYVIVLANLPLIIMAAYSINYTFAIKTFVCIVMLGLCLLYVPYPVITSDKLLVSIFGGFFLGIGVGLTMRAGCAVDGIEVLAVYTWRRSSFTISEIILALNIIIFSIAAFKFGIQTSLYSMLTYFTASKTVDYVVEGIEAYTGVTIISGQSEEIKKRLVNNLGRGITVYKGERGYLPGQYHVSSDVDIIFTVITRLELRRLKNLVNEVDPKAFVFANTIKEASGGIIKRRHMH